MRTFVYKAGKVNGKLRAKGILLIDIDIGLWRSQYYHRKIRLRPVGSKLEVVLQVTLVNSTEWIESDPNAITKDDEFVLNAKIQHQMQLSQLRTEMMFDVVSSDIELSLPLMLSDEEDDKLVYLRGKFHRTADCIDDLPEVRSFIKSELAEVKDDPLALIAIGHLNIPTRLPIPVNTWLPCFVKSGCNIWSGLYMTNGTNFQACVVGLDFQPAAEMQVLSRVNDNYVIGVFESIENSKCNMDFLP